MGMTVEQERIPLLAEEVALWSGEAFFVLFCVPHCAFCGSSPFVGRSREEGNVTSWTDTSPGSVRRSKTPHRAGSGYVPALHGNTGTGAVRP